MRPEYAQIGLVLASVFFLLQVVSIIITIWQRLRRNPPIDQTLADYVKRREFELHCTQNDGVQKQLFELQRTQTKDVGDEIRGFKDSLSAWQGGISHQIGRIDGRLSSMEDHKKHEH